MSNSTMDSLADDFLDNPADDFTSEIDAANGENDLSVLDGKSVLVVDDNEVNRELVEAAFELADAKPVQAGSADEALSMTVHEQFDLILLDLCMPGMDPITFASELRKSETHANTPIIVCSAQPDDVIETATKLTGAVGYVKKPISVDELLQLASSVVG